MRKEHLHEGPNSPRESRTLFAVRMIGRTQSMPLAIHLGFDRDVGVGLVLSVILLLVSTLLLPAIRCLERNALVRDEGTLRLRGEGIATGGRSRCPRLSHRLVE